MMKTATARLRGLRGGYRSSSAQSGVALLQVLLISALISLVAIRFSQTARDQIEIALALEERSHAQLDAYSTLNEVIFLELSADLVYTGEGLHAGHATIPNKSAMNRFGQSVVWRDGVSVTVQDLNGLLPQMFPEHPLWSVLLSRLGLSEPYTQRYLGSWIDFQDPDSLGQFGGEEPDTLPSGHKYLNGYSQSESTLKWIFFDRLDLVEDLRAFSNLYGKYDSNILNFPEGLLLAFFERDVVDEILKERESSGSIDYSLRQILPLEFSETNVYIHDSSRLAIEIEASHGGAGWVSAHVIDLAASQNPPFKVIQYK